MLAELMAFSRSAESVWFVRCWPLTEGKVGGYKWSRALRGGCLGVEGCSTNSRATRGDGTLRCALGNGTEEKGDFLQGGQEASL